MGTIIISPHISLLVHQSDKNVYRMIESISKFAIFLVVFGVAAIAITIGLILGFVLNQCMTVAGPENLKIASPQPRFIQLSWQNSEETEHCSVTYMIRYRVNNGVDIEATTTRLYYSFTTLHLCFELSVNVWTISDSGEESQEYASAYYNSQPIASTDIPKPLGGIFSLTHRGLELTWPKARELDTCDVRYNIRITTDKTLTNEMLIYFERVTIDDSLYCFAVDVHIETIIGESVSGEYVYHYTAVLQPPQGIELTSSSAEHTLTATWHRHGKQSQCDVQYRVKHSLLNSEPTTYITPETTITFDTAYCNIATLVFTTIASNRESYRHTWHRIEGLPNSVGAVQNIRIDWITEDTAWVLWDSPANVEACTDIIYAVTATNDEDTVVSSTCTGHLSCQLTLKDFCPIISLTIQAASIEGEKSTLIYNCSVGD